jgi:UDP-N-acetylglucosamine 2-epimerase
LEDLSGLAVFATQVAPKRSAYDTDDEDEVLAWGVCRAMALLPRERLVIKLHPRQRGREVMYREIADRCGLQGCRIIREVPLSMLLAHCELFITESSTAACEACLWDVPILVVNLTRRGDIVPYVPGGVALGAYAEEDIAPTLRKLLENDESRKRLAANRGRFVERHLYRMDGRATHRVMKVLGRMIHAGSAPAGRRPGLARAGKADIMR